MILLASCDPLTNASIAEPWPESRGRSPSGENVMQCSDSSSRRAIRRRLWFGRRNLSGSFMSSMCVRLLLSDIPELSGPLLDRAGNRHQHHRCGYPPGGRRYPDGGHGYSRGGHGYPDCARGYPNSCCWYPHGGRRYPHDGC